MLRKHGLVAGAEGGEQASGALDVGEDEGDASLGQLCDAPSPLHCLG